MCYLYEQILFKHPQMMLTILLWLAGCFDLPLCEFLVLDQPSELCVGELLQLLSCPALCKIQRLRRVWPWTGVVRFDKRLMAFQMFTDPRQVKDNWAARHREQED